MVKQAAFDVVIVGGGIMGLSTGYRLAREGHSTLILERSTAGFEASSRNAGGVRQQFRDPRETALAMYSAEIWRHLGAELDADLEYRQGGGFRLALEADDVPELRSIFERDRRAGLPVELLTPAEVATLVPVDPTAFQLATFCPTDAQANPHKVCAAFAAAARKAGAELRENEGVRTIVRSDDGFEIATDTAVHRGRQVVIAAGPWSAELLRPLGTDLPLVPRRPEMAETEPVEPFLDAFVSLGDLRGYGRQAASGALNIGVRSIDAPLDAPESSHQRVKSSLEGWARLFPRLNGVEVRRTWTGYTNWTPDGCPVIGPVEGVEDLYVCTGFSGHGYALGPAVGVVLTDLLIGREPPVDVRALGLERFL